MDQVFSFLYGPGAKRVSRENKGGKKRRSITCHTDRANEANKMFIICMAFLIIGVLTATYGPGIDQSQHAQSVGHLIINVSIYPTSE